MSKETTKLTLCKKHPKYKAIFKPRVPCVECRRIYREKLVQQLEVILRNIGPG